MTSPEVRSPQIPRGLYVMVLMAAATIAVAGVRSIPSVGPILLGMTLVVVAWPVADWCKHKGMPAAVCLVALLATTFGIAAVVIGAIAWAIVQLVDYIGTSNYQTQLTELQETISTELARFGVSQTDVDDAINSIDLSTVTKQAYSAFSGVLGVAGVLGVLAVVMLFMVMDARPFVDRLDDSLAQTRPDIYSAFNNFARSTRHYFAVSTVFGFIVATLNVIALLVLGVPLALTWGVLSLITNYIPNIGFVIGVIPPAIVALLAEGWEVSVAVIVIYIATNVVVQTVIQPKIVGDALGLSATVTFLSLIFWGFVIGPIGTLIAVPMTLLTKSLLIDIDPVAYWVSPLISLDNPPQDSESATRQPRE